MIVSDDDLKKTLLLQSMPLRQCRVEKGIVSQLDY
jgi:hypothetical protein